MAQIFIDQIQNQSRTYTIPLIAEKGTVVLIEATPNDEEVRKIVSQATLSFTARGGQETIAFDVPHVETYPDVRWSFAFYLMNGDFKAEQLKI